MEGGSTVFVYIAYGLIGAFLLLLIVIFLRTALLVSTLLFMPVARVLRSVLPGRKARATLLDD
jgi:hypothetical protein